MTIVALSTPYGAGAIAIVRLSGADARRIAATLTPAPLTPRHAHLRRLRARGELLDEAVVLYFAAPASFTGEDVVEFHTHGGVAVASAIIDALIAAGARAARPGEFSKRAVLNGKMSVAKAESLAALISARTSAAARVLARTLDGELGAFCRELRAQLLQILAHVEVCIDYAEDDLPPETLATALATLDAACGRVGRIVRLSAQRRGLIDGFAVAIIGRPNVGKSSLLNALLGSARAIVSDEAGTTRDSVEERVVLPSGGVARLIDTAGIRAASGVEAQGIARSLAAAQAADVVVCVFDGSRPATREDGEILRLARDLGGGLDGDFWREFCAQNGVGNCGENLGENLGNNLGENLCDNGANSNLGEFWAGFCGANVALNSNLAASSGQNPAQNPAPNTSPTPAQNFAQNPAPTPAPKKIIFALNKCDLPRRFEPRLPAALEISAKSDISGGADALKTALDEHLRAQDLGEVMLVTNRQAALAQSALEALGRSRGLLAGGELELFAFEANAALKCIGELTEPACNDELLDAMFSGFCLGK